MSNSLEVFGSSYDQIAPDYDAVWSVHVEQPQQRLTRELAITAGDRVVDLGCGTGIDTVAMAKLANPGEVLAVDPSEAMLESATRRAQAGGLTLTTHCSGATEFTAHCPDGAFDVVSLRFCLGYLDASQFLQTAPRMLRPGGRLGIVSILASSAPQAYGVYAEMAAESGVPAEPMSAVASAREIAIPLEQAGSEVVAEWTHSFRLQFASGADLAQWLRASGIATNQTLATLPNDMQDALWAELGRRVESRRQGATIPLDFDIAGVVARAGSGRPFRA